MTKPPSFPLQWMMERPEAAAPEERRGLWNTLTGLRPAALLGAGLAIFTIVSAFGLGGESCTFDEGMHLLAGYAVLERGDYRLSPDNPPLGRVLCALPLRFMSVSWPTFEELWRGPAPWDLAFRFLYQSSNDPDQLLLAGRIPTVLGSLVLIAAVYIFSFKSFGPTGGLFALILSIACPTLLGHGHLCTTDVMATALIVLSVLAFLGFLEKPTLLRSAGCGVLVGCAVAAKFNALFLGPGMIGIAVLAWHRRRGSGLPAGAPKTPALRVLGLAAVLLLCSYVVLWAAYGFRYRGSPDPGFEFPWKDVEVQGSLLNGPANFARRHHLLPEAFIYGFQLLQSNGVHGHPTYALGLHASRGWWWYFPLAFLVKTPVAMLAWFGAGLAAWLLRVIRKDPREDFPVLLIALYGVIALSQNLTIGIRHLLPVYPFFIMLAAGAAAAAQKALSPFWRRTLVPGSLAVLVLEGALAAPFFLSYFNAPSRLLGGAHELLVDSNLDWGQDLGRLKAFMDREGISEVKLSYFGAASPRHLGLRHQVLPGFNIYSKFEPEWPRAATLAPGDIVAVSASNFVGFFSDDKTYYQRKFGSQDPIATIGDSILVFRVLERPSIAGLPFSEAGASAPGSATPTLTAGPALRTPTVGGAGGIEFVDQPQPLLLLIGLRYSIGAFETSPSVIRSLQPLYLRGNDFVEGSRHGESVAGVQQILARTGYAVGGLIARGTARVDGFKVVFMRIAGDSLNPSDAYESEWIGGAGGGPPVRLGGTGAYVVGLHGRALGDLDSLGLLLLSK